MSCLLFLESLENKKCNINDLVDISEEAAGQGGTQVFLDAGRSYPFEDLLEAAILCSANDATVALAEKIAGSEAAFVEQMNARAKEFGLSSVFTNATGLDNEEQQLCANDLAVIAAEVCKYPLFFQYSSVWMDTFVHTGGRETEMTNSNKLIKQLQNCDGMMTGSSKKAGYCGVFSVKQGGARFICVVLDAPNSAARFTLAKEALGQASANYTVKQIAKENQKVKKNLPVDGGALRETNIYAATDCSLLIKKGEEQGIEKVLNLPESLAAPLSSGQVVGTMDVTVNGQTVKTIDLIVKDEIPAQSFGLAFHSILRDWIRL